MTAAPISIDCGLFPKKDSTVATASRTKRKLKNRPKYKRERSLRDRKIKAKKKASHKRGLGRSKARRKARGGKKK